MILGTLTTAGKRGAGGTAMFGSLFNWFSIIVCNCGNFTIATNIIIAIHLVVNSKINTKSHLWSWSAGIILFSIQVFTLLHCHCITLPYIAKTLPRHCLLLQIHCQDIAGIILFSNPTVQAPQSSLFKLLSLCDAFWPPPYLNCSLSSPQPQRGGPS